MEAHYNAMFGIHGFDRDVAKPHYKRRVLYDNIQQWEPCLDRDVSKSALYPTVL